MRNTTAQCVISLAIIAAAGQSAQSGMMDRTEIGLIPGLVEGAPIEEVLLPRSGAVVGVVATDNEKFANIPNLSDEALAFDGRTIGTDTARLLVRHLQKNGTFPVLYFVDKGVVVAKTLQEIAAEKGISCFIGADLVDASIDLIPMNSLKVTVPNPKLTISMRFWLKDSLGAEIWSSNQSVAVSRPGMDKIMKWYKSTELKTAESKVREAGGYRYLTPEGLYWVDQYESMLREALGKSVSGALRSLADASGTIAAFRLARSDGDAPTRVEAIIEYGSVAVRIRARKWKGVEGIMRAKVGDQGEIDKITYQVLCDGRTVDGGVIPALRQDARGTASYKEFTSFDHRFDLVLPTGRRSILILLDIPQEWVLQVADSGDEITPDTPAIPRRFRVMARMEGDLELQGLIRRDIAVGTGKDKILSVYRNLQPYDLGRGWLDKLVIGSGRGFNGQWEAMIREDDPYAFLDGINWDDPKLIALLADKSGARKSALKAIQKEKYVAAAPALVETVTFDADEEVREEAMQALAILDDPRAVYFVVRAYAWDANPDVVERAYDYLIKTKRPEAVLFLEEYYYWPLMDSSELQARVGRVLQKITGKKYKKANRWLL